ncbi:MAG: type II toxin-antitoxin system RelE/ParE family toxin [Sulfuricella sp.]|nr:type II toxin-antitoxin system RelE/ParE family toxin [Sulfuricella sp.]
MEFKPNYLRPFISFVKKQHRPFKARIEDETSKICRNSEIGEFKTGDLSGIQVHKFRFDNREWLIAYHVKEGIVEVVLIDFFQIGTHENFYQDLKAYLQSKGWYK